MNLLAQLKERFRPVLAPLAGSDAKLAELLGMIRPAQDAKFGDYQANFAMPLGKTLGKPPRDVASQIVGEAKLADLCSPPEIAGPGFINLRILDSKLAELLNAAVHDERLGITSASPARTIVIDYSSPNVAKPMHVGHIRSTVIGDAIYRILSFLGHQVISDNHLGDWGTQFGMIIYGYKHFADAKAFRANPVAELSRLYKFVHKLVDYRESLAALPDARERLAERQGEIERLKATPPSGDKAADKKSAQALARAQAQAKEQADAIEGLERKIAAVEADKILAPTAQAHARIDEAVLTETAKLHGGDP
ncbi:MAG: arginine--tRNA ligase, partial [Pirellulaceae bacterium]|nr:arginine--tRNA ligase [Pirellulaceae bacterium]